MLRTLKCGNNENDRLKRKLVARDTEIHKLNKENAALSKIISQYKDSTASSANHSTDTQGEKSQDEKRNTIRKIPLIPPQAKSRASRASLGASGRQDDDIFCTGEGMESSLIFRFTHFVFL